MVGVLVLSNIAIAGERQELLDKIKEIQRKNLLIKEFIMEHGDTQNGENFNNVYIEDELTSVVITSASTSDYNDSMCLHSFYKPEDINAWIASFEAEGATEIEALEAVLDTELMEYKDARDALKECKKYLKTTKKVSKTLYVKGMNEYKKLKEELK